MDDDASAHRAEAVIAPLACLPFLPCQLKREDLNAEMEAVRKEAVELRKLNLPRRLELEAYSDDDLPPLKKTKNC